MLQNLHYQLNLMKVITTLSYDRLPYPSRKLLLPNYNNAPPVKHLSMIILPCSKGVTKENASLVSYFTCHHLILHPHSYFISPPLPHYLIHCARGSHAWEARTREM